MEFYEPENRLEELLREKCSKTLTPFSGTLELTPACNMDCRFCYVHQDKLHHTETGRLLSADEWLSVIRQAMDSGLYALLVTGGEPLLYPEFKKLWSTLSGMGLVLTLNSNGTLFNEDWIAFFKQYGCSRFNISLYGTDEDTYEKLCGYRDGFARTMRTLQLLKENHLPFKLSVSLTPQNVDQMVGLADIARELGAPISFAAYMFPGTRRGIDREDQYRLTPEAAAAATITGFHLRNPKADYEASCRYSLSKLAAPQKFESNQPGFVCYAAKTNFWLSWNGFMRPCGVFALDELSYDLKQHPFKGCWTRMVSDTRSRECRCSDCLTCSRRDLCQTCPAVCYSETGSITGKPEYQCRMTAEMVCLFQAAVAEYDRAAAVHAGQRQPEISIIIPIYNTASYLPRCIESILKQRFQSFELILVDDGSTDESGSICDRYAAQDSRIRVLHRQNSGVSAARNAGMDAARAPYITFCDSDDFVENTWCEAMYRKLQDNPDAMVMTNVWVGNETWPRKVTIHEDLENPDRIPLERFAQMVTFAYIWNKLYRTDLIRSNNLRFDESISYNEDYLFSEGYRALCGYGVYITAPQYIHLNRQGSLTYQGLAQKGKHLEDLNISAGKLEFRQF